MLRVSDCETRSSCGHRQDPGYGVTAATALSTQHSQEDFLSGAALRDITEHLGFRTGEVP